MSQATDLTNHIRELFEADPSLIAKLNAKWFYVGIPTAFPAIYIDGLYLVDDKIDTWRFNVSFVTSDMSIEGIGIAQQVQSCLQASHFITAQGISVRPEPENTKTRYLIPCSAYMVAL